MEFKIVTDYTEARKLWERFSPNQTLWDLWAVRDCFIKGTNYPLYFIVGYEGDKVVGVLPLCHNLDLNCYSFLGEEFPEDNRLLIEDKTRLSEFLKQCPPRTYLDYIWSGDKVFFPSLIVEDNPDDCNYYLDLTNFSDFDDYLKTFNKKHRKNLRYDLRGLAEQGFAFHFESNFQENVIEAIAGYSAKRFAGESFFTLEGFKKSLANLMQLAETNNWLHVVVIKKDGQIFGAQFAVLFAGTYNVIMGGHDFTVDNLGKLLTVGHLQRAMAAGAKRINFMTGGSWKGLWNFTKEEVYSWKNIT